MFQYIVSYWNKNLCSRPISSKSCIFLKDWEIHFTNQKWRFLSEVHYSSKKALASVLPGCAVWIFSTWNWYISHKRLRKVHFNSYILFMALESVASSVYGSWGVQWKVSYLGTIICNFYASLREEYLRLIFVIIFVDKYRGVER